MSPNSEAGLWLIKNVYNLAPITGNKLKILTYTTELKYAMGGIFIHWYLPCRRNHLRVPFRVLPSPLRSLVGLAVSFVS